MDWNKEIILANGRAEDKAGAEQKAKKKKNKIPLLSPSLHCSFREGKGIHGLRNC
jgi:hypothetical protein